MRPRLASDDDLRWLRERLRAMDVEYRVPAELLEGVAPELRHEITAGPLDLCRGLALAARLLEPRVVLELGRGVGTGTLMLYAGLGPGNDLWSVDSEPPGALLPSLLVEDPRVHLVTGDSLDLEVYRGHLPVGIDLWRVNVAATDVPFDALWEVYRPLCRPGALITLDGLTDKDIQNERNSAAWCASDAPKVEFSDADSGLHSRWFVHQPDTARIQFNPLTAMAEARAASSVRARV